MASLLNTHQMGIPSLSLLMMNTQSSDHKPLRMSVREFLLGIYTKFE